MHPATRQSDTQRHLGRIGELATQLHEAREENARLRAELAATMLPYQGHTALLINGVLTIIQHSGVVYEMVERDDYSATETVFGKREFRKLPSVPGSPAARIDAVAPALTEMGCVGGEPLERVS